MKTSVPSSVSPAKARTNVCVYEAPDVLSLIGTWMVGSPGVAAPAVPAQSSVAAKAAATTVAKRSVADHVVCN
jgi:hypothetical protein